jgi:hypothetical protein
MFSWNCLACGFSLRDCRNCSIDNWMNQGVVLTKGGSRIVGSYDSYGNLGGYNLVDQIDDFSIYHKACWELKGKPEFTEPSQSADDQGFCHAMHGKPLAAPTHNWLEQCPTWHVLDKAIDSIWSRHSKLKYDDGKAQFTALAAEDQTRLLAAYKADSKAMWDAYRAARSAWFDSDDDSIPEPVSPDRVESFEFEGVTYHASVLW